MRQVLLRLTAIGCLAMVSLSPAQACSGVTYKKGLSPKEIKQRSDVRKVEGEFRNTEILPDQDGDAFIVGTIKTKGGRSWKTIHPIPPNYNLSTCGAGMYHKPEGDAKGTFWIKRNPRNGRYQLMLWEGDYINDENSKRYGFDESSGEKE